MSALDDAILRYREDPSEENRAAVIVAQREYVGVFYREQAAEFTARTSVPRGRADGTVR